MTAMLSGSVFNQERKRNLENVISDLRSELCRTQAQLLDERNRRIKAEGELNLLRRNING